MGALLASDKAAYTSRLRRLVEVEHLDERISLVFAHDRAECPPNIVPSRVVWLVIKVGVGGLAQLLVLVPRRDRLVRAECQPLKTAVVLAIVPYCSSM